VDDGFDLRKPAKSCPGQVHIEHHAIRDKCHCERSEAISHTCKEIATLAQNARSQ
jgi:hypothetical protein